MSDKDGKGHPIMFSAVLIILCRAFLSAAEHAANHTEMQYGGFIKGHQQP
jgi:hypothetical protein